VSSTLWQAVDQGADLSLGTLELEIPDYVNIDHDAAARRVEMSVKDRDQRNQREMWGMDCPRYDQQCDQTRD
jgi:hypothetical protein